MLDMRPALPEWLPPPVKVMAEILGYGAPVSSRLLYNPKMKKVWSKLANEEPKHDAVKTALKPWREAINLNAFRPNDLGAAAIYAVCVREMQADFFATKSKVKGSVDEWRDIATACRAIWSVDYAPVHDPALAEALERTAQHFEGLANWLDARSGSRWLGKGKTERAHEEVTRAKVAAFITEADALYPTKLRMPLAVMSSVALDIVIDGTDISNWRALMARTD